MPRRVTLPPSTSTVIRLASSSALRLNASSILARSEVGDTRGLTGTICHRLRAEATFCLGDVGDTPIGGPWRWVQILDGVRERTCLDSRGDGG